MSLTKYFQNFDSGDSVALVTELGVQGSGFPRRMQGRTGKVIEKRGKSYVVEIKDFDLKKKFVVRPIHLKKILNKK